jgi:hypothetical protein
VLGVQKLDNLCDSDGCPGVPVGSAHPRVHRVEPPSIPVIKVFRRLFEYAHFLRDGYSGHKFFGVKRFVFDAAACNVKRIQELRHDVEDVVRRM